MNTLAAVFGLLLITAPVLANTDHSTPTDQHKQQSQSTAITTAKADNRYIILFNRQTNGNSFAPAKANALINNLGGKTIHALPSIKAIAAELTQQQVAQLKANPQVALIEKDPLRSFQTEAQPYGISQIQADLVSDSNTANITICITDTGIDLSHEDLPGPTNISGEVSNTLTTEMDIGQWHDDSYGHGTHMAGTIAAIGGNNIGSVGVNPGGNIKLHVVKIIDDPGWWPFRGSDLIAAVERCQAFGTNIINMSIAGNNASVAEQLALQNAFDAGILLVAASILRKREATRTTKPFLMS